MAQTHCLTTVEIKLPATTKSVPVILRRLVFGSPRYRSSIVPETNGASYARLSTDAYVFAKRMILAVSEKISMLRRTFWTMGAPMLCYGDHRVCIMILCNGQPRRNGHSADTPWSVLLHMRP